ncbi:MAG: RyR domain-containing protein [Sandaracinobacteroides sp.]
MDQGFNPQQPHDRVRDHLLVVGDHPLAGGVVEAATRRNARVTWITNSRFAVAVPGAVVIAGPLGPEQARDHAGDASRAIVAFADETRQFPAIAALRAQAPALPITVNYTDSWFAERTNETAHLAGVRFVSQVHLAIRDLHWRNPLPLIAQGLGHRRIHALLFGFGRGGDAILSDLLLCSLTGSLEPPRITIVDPDADAVRRDLFRRCPEIGLSAEISFIDPGSTEDPRRLPVEALRGANATDPFTTTHVSIDSGVRALALARAFHALAGREGWTVGPTFTRLADGGELPRLPVTGESAELLMFGANADFAESIGLFDPNSDLLARMFHEAYRRSARPGTPANCAWDDLAEEFRESNRRLLVHLPAKLLTAGVDLGAWLRYPLPITNLAGGIPLPNLDADPALMERLAELEHRRWMVDRRLSGWRHGPVRDNGARMHPDLVPFEALDEYTRELDRAIVRQAWETLGSSRGSGFFPHGPGIGAQVPTGKAA